MERGFVVDNALTAIAVGNWAPGTPQKSWRTGTKAPTIAFPIGAFRCSACGYVELFAGKEFAAE